MLTLYKAGNSICTQKVVITLAEKAVRYETVNINLFKNEQYDPAYLKINPKGVVPSLIDDGKIIVESTLICEYLDETISTPHFGPRGRAAAFRLPSTPERCRRSRGSAARDW
jgi:glutathione S-transferase